jgi:hypothetical protein
VSIEDALDGLVSPILAALTPPVLFRWGKVEAGLDEYVQLSSIVSSSNYLDDSMTDNKQFTIATRTSMVRARAISRAIFTEIQRAKGIFSGVSIHQITHVRDVELPDSEVPEFIIASEYKITYQGGL